MKTSPLPPALQLELQPLGFVFNKPTAKALHRLPLRLSDPGKKSSWADRLARAARKATAL